MKPSDQDPHFFHSDLRYMLTTGMLQVYRIEIRGSVVLIEIFSMTREKFRLQFKAYLMDRLAPLYARGWGLHFADITTENSSDWP